jgi:hypothetical protein
MKAERVSKLTFASGAALAMAAGASGVQAQGVSGAYVGILAGAPKGDHFGGYTVNNYSFTGASVGLFAGYNAVQNGIVYGFEADYTNKADVKNPGTFSAYDGMGLDKIVDLRGRIGTVFGKTFVYGAAGVTVAQATTAFSVPTSATGANIAIGVEQAIGANGFIGAEVMHRKLKLERDLGSSYYFPNDTVDMNSITIRAGLRF